jgi:hypothetical protein
VPKLSKRNKTYRQDSDIASLVEKASEMLDIPQAIIVDACILNQINQLVEKELRYAHVRKMAMRDPLLVRALAQFVKLYNAANK